MTTTTDRDEITLEAAAVRAMVSTSTVSRWVARRIVKSRRHPETGRRMIDVASLEEFLATGEPSESAAT